MNDYFGCALSKSSVLRGDAVTPSTNQVNQEHKMCGSAENIFALDGCKVPGSWTKNRIDRYNDLTNGKSFMSF